MRLGRSQLLEQHKQGCKKSKQKKKIKSRPGSLETTRRENSEGEKHGKARCDTSGWGGGAGGVGVAEYDTPLQAEATLSAVALSALTPVSTSSLHIVFLLLAERQRNIFDLVTAHLKGILGNLNALFTVHYLRNFVEGTKTRRRSRIDGLPLPDVFLWLQNPARPESANVDLCLQSSGYAELQIT